MLSKFELPRHYRETSYRFNNQVLVVAGLARPDFDDEPEKVLEFLKLQGVSSIFGLDVTRHLINLGKSMDLIYFNISIPDFTAPDIRIYDLIYETVLEEGMKGNKVAVHCRGGIGRTGVVLAALKLKELSQDEAFYDSSEWKQKAVFLPYSRSPISVTSNVAKAVELVRAVPGSEGAIEAEVQVESLMLYEKHLRELSPSKAHGPR
jgi:hypothetical protein